MLGILKNKVWFSLDIVQWSLLKMLRVQLTHCSTSEPKKKWQKHSILGRAVQQAEDTKIDLIQVWWGMGHFISTECFVFRIHEQITLK